MFQFKILRWRKAREIFARLWPWMLLDMHENGIRSSTRRWILRSNKTETKNIILARRKKFYCHCGFEINEKKIHRVFVWFRTVKMMFFNNFNKKNYDNKTEWFSSTPELISLQRTKSHVYRQENPLPVQLF